jgi:hypothetical protein
METGHLGNMIHVGIIKGIQQRCEKDWICDSFEFASVISICKQSKFLNLILIQFSSKNCKIEDIFSLLYLNLRKITNLKIKLDS